MSERIERVTITLWLLVLGLCCYCYCCSAATYYDAVEDLVQSSDKPHPTDMLKWVGALNLRIFPEDLVPPSKYESQGESSLFGYPQFNWTHPNDYESLLWLVMTEGEWRLYAEFGEHIVRFLKYYRRDLESLHELCKVVTLSLAYMPVLKIVNPDAYYDHRILNVELVLQT